MLVPVEFVPTETWLLDEPLDAVLTAVGFETEHVAVERFDGGALLVSTRTSGTHAHVAVLHRRESVAGVSTAATPADPDGPLRAGFQHDSTPRTDSVKRALHPFSRRTFHH